MRKLLACIAALAAVTLALPAAAGEDSGNGKVYVRISGTDIAIGNDLVERSWSRFPFLTSQIFDKRSGELWSERSADFSLGLGAAEVPSSVLDVTDATADKLKDGMRLTLRLEGIGLAATRTVEVYEGVAGFRTTTTLHLNAPLPLRGYDVETANVGSAAATIHAFRAGADWREPDWEGPPLTIGDPHAGTWRESRSAAEGTPLSGAAQWISVRRGDASLFIVMERNDQPSSVASYDGTAAEIGVDHSRDVVSLGPLEEEIHAENPTPAPGRMRVAGPGTFELEASFLGLGTNPDDESWQFFKYLTEHRLVGYDKDITFNSNGTDTNAISTGLKDDMDFATVQAVAPIAKRLGIETFILDDGWQAISGDWYPDSPEYPEPRWDGSETSKFKPRFPDSEFKAVRKEIAPMKLGLWMSPMHFNPNSVTYKQHPEWVCTPLGHGLAAYNTLEPDSGANEAGIGTWGPDAIPHVEKRIREAIEKWGARYFKFDFMAWLDCAGQGDLYDYRTRFIAMLDRLQADHSDVTFQIDETNDYRLFPFESVSRGPSWFQNGAREPDRLLHNIWNLSPYIPAFSLGQHLLGGRAYERYPVDTLMAVALTSHITFFSELRTIPDEVIDQAAPWLEYYKRNREHFTQMVLPLLDDPLQGGWTALQSFNPETGVGAVLAFRQKDALATKTVALRNIPAGEYDLFLGLDETPVGTFTAEQLATGVDVTLDPDGAAVYLIRPRKN